ncbi:MAG: helix-turn-helix domain-containing protein [Pseudomonadales bacterium]|jgi:AraC-like DNA-binding protein|nr:helix-turn-helix domain-containing protein [Pseudomonadales bacterium]
MKYYSASGHSLPQQDHLHARDILSLNTEFFSVEVDPLDLTTYHAEGEVLGLGPLTLARIDSTGAIVSRRQEEYLNPDFKRYSLFVALEGETIISHHLGMSELRTGHFVLIDNSYPRSMFVPNWLSLLQVNIPRQVLTHYLQEPQQYEALVLSSAAAPSGAYNSINHSTDNPLFGMLLSSWEKLKVGSLSEFVPAICDNLLRRIAEAYTGHVQQHTTSRKARRITQVRELIEERLFDPELSVEAVADGLNVSSRYLRALFMKSEKISHYILRRRLEECARLLSDPRQQQQSITNIAFNCGFNSMAHFSRTFKKAYQVTPRDYRRHHLHGALQVRE